MDNREKQQKKKGEESEVKVSGKKKGEVIGPKRSDLKNLALMLVGYAGKNRGPEV